jgi:glycosyltransferase involved in cell wall biosynthesis
VFDGLPDAPTPNLLSVVTPCALGRWDFLETAWQSLAEQQLPEGWNWEWVVQADGPATDLQANIMTFTQEHPSVRFAANTRPLGAAATRNAALGRVRGELLMNLDADDQFEVGGVAPLVSVMAGHGELAWAGGRTNYNRENGSVDPYPDRLPIGRIEPGWFGDDWLAHDRPAGHPSAFIMRTVIWSAFGGWMALYGSEDTGTLAAISEYWPGWGLNQVVLRYRKWHGETTAAADWSPDKPVHYRVIARRLASIRALSIK